MRCGDVQERVCYAKNVKNRNQYKLSVLYTNEVEDVKKDKTPTPQNYRLINKSKLNLYITHD